MNKTFVVIKSLFSVVTMCLIAVFLFSGSVFGSIEIISTNSSGILGDKGGLLGTCAPLSTISADGRYVVFTSLSTNLLQGVTAGQHGYIHDRFTGITEVVDVNNAGELANSYSDCFSISADGNYIAFMSYADNLVAGDINGTLDVFVRDRQNGITELVSVTNSGAPANGYSGHPVISSDGRYVAYTSGAKNLGANLIDVFVRDRVSKMTERISVPADGSLGGEGFAPSISADGRYVAFLSDGVGLVPETTMCKGFNRHLYVRDRTTNTTEWISQNNHCVSYTTWGLAHSISGDGNIVAFVSYDGIIVYDRQTKNVEILTGGVSDAIGDDPRFRPALNFDGRFVAFTTWENLVPEYNNGYIWDVFIKDRLSGTTEILSINNDGIAGSGSSMQPSISLDGRYIAFESIAYNLVPCDNNGYMDVFVYDRQGDVSNYNGCGPKLGAKILVNPNLLIFNSIEITGSSSKTVNVSNTGKTDLSVYSITISGANASSFAQTNNCSIMPPGAACSISVTFTPASLGEKNAILTIATNDSNAPIVDVSLSGTGVDTIIPSITITPNSTILWPPNHKMVDVLIDGSASDTGSGIASIEITVTDEYGVYNMTVPGFGSTIQLEAWRDGTDRDGRRYAITAVVTDNAGNQSTATTEVLVPHDMR